MRTRTVPALAITAGTRLADGRVITRVETQGECIHIAAVSDRTYGPAAVHGAVYDLTQEVEIIDTDPRRAPLPFIIILRARRFNGELSAGKIAARCENGWLAYTDDGEDDDIFSDEDILEWEPLILLTPKFAREIVELLPPHAGIRLAELITAAGGDEK